MEGICGTTYEAVHRERLFGLYVALFINIIYRVDCKPINQWTSPKSSLEFDAIILIGALVHLPYAEFQLCIENVLLGLKSEGKLLLTMKEGAEKYTDDDRRGIGGRPFVIK